MRTFFAAVTGLIAAATLVAAVIWATDDGSAASLSPFLVLVAIGGSSVLGGFLAARIHNSPNAISSFAVLQLFFTLATFTLLSTPSATWFRLLALVVVIPCAALGGKLAGAPVTDPSSRPDSESSDDLGSQLQQRRK